jgi:hypothetical protein
MLALLFQFDRDFRRSFFQLAAVKAAAWHHLQRVVGIAKNRRKWSVLASRHWTCSVNHIQLGADTAD